MCKNIKFLIHIKNKNVCLLLIDFYQILLFVLRVLPLRHNKKLKKNLRNEKSHYLFCLSFFRLRTVKIYKKKKIEEIFFSVCLKSSRCIKPQNKKLKRHMASVKEYHHSQVQYKQHVLSLNHKRMNETKKKILRKEKIDEP